MNIMEIPLLGGPARGRKWLQGKSERLQQYILIPISGEDSALPEAARYLLEELSGRPVYVFDGTQSVIPQEILDRLESCAVELLRMSYRTLMNDNDAAARIGLEIRKVRRELSVMDLGSPEQSTGQEKLSTL